MFGAVLELGVRRICQHRIIGIVQLGERRTGDRLQQFSLQSRIWNDDTGVQAMCAAKELCRAVLNQSAYGILVGPLVEIIDPIALATRAIGGGDVGIHPECQMCISNAGRQVGGVAPGSGNDGDLRAARRQILLHPVRERRHLGRWQVGFAAFAAACHRERWQERGHGNQNDRENFFHCRLLTVGCLLVGLVQSRVGRPLGCKRGSITNGWVPVV